MKQYTHYIYFVLYAYLLLFYPITASTAPSHITPSNAQDTIRHTTQNQGPKISQAQFSIILSTGEKHTTTLDVQSINRNTPLHLNPIKTDEVSSMYEYFIINVVTTERTNRWDIGAATPHIPPPTNKKQHLYIALIATEMENNSSASLSIATFFSHLISKTPPPPLNIYQFILAKIDHIQSLHDNDENDDDTDPLLLSFYQLKQIWKKNDQKTESEPSYIPSNEDNPSSLSDIMNVSKVMNNSEAALELIEAGEDPPFPIPAPGIGKKQGEYILIATHADDEDPPFPIPAPGIGDTADGEKVKRTVRQYILVPSVPSFKNLMPVNDTNNTDDSAKNTMDEKYNIWGGT